MVPGISDQWLAVIMCAALGIGLFGYGVIDHWRLGRRIRRRRDQAAVEPQPGE